MKLMSIIREEIAEKSTTAPETLESAKKAVKMFNDFFKKTFGKEFFGKAKFDEDYVYIWFANITPDQITRPDQILANNAFANATVKLRMVIPIKSYRGDEIPLKKFTMKTFDISTQLKGTSLYFRKLDGKSVEEVMNKFIKKMSQNEKIIVGMKRDEGI